ncbi:MAG: formate dehydrogenase, partial [Massilia sp.]|nr:formate dehydrogenase [Massilia sp.]
GAFFESCPDRVEASTEIASHLKRYWAPRMRSQLLQHLDQQRGDGLSALVLASITEHRVLLAPAR